MREGSGWLCRGEGRRWSLISSQHRQHVHSTGGDKQVLNVHTHTHGHIHTHTQRLLTTHCHPNVHTCTHTHTSISTHDKVTQITFTHSRCINVIFSLTSIIGPLSVHSGQWTSCCNGGSSCGPDSIGELSPRTLIQASVLVLLSTSEGNWCNEGCRGKGGEAEKGGGVTLHTEEDRSLLASHMITHTGRYTYNNMYTYKYVL